MAKISLSSGIPYSLNGPPKFPGFTDGGAGVRWTRRTLVAVWRLWRL